jgi:ABC-type phosphate transport system substrate-binding protein
MFAKFVNLKKVSKTLVFVSILVSLLVSAMSVLAATPNPNEVVIDGSTTVYPVVRIGITQFPALFPGTIMTVYSTGSGHGQISVMNDYVDIGMSSSNCSGSNAFVPTSGGFTSGSYTLTTNSSPYNCSTLTQTAFARDGLTILVNKQKQTECGGALTTITRDQVGAIYRGEINNWSQLNGSCPSSTLTPRARIVGSGTRQSLLEMLGSARLTSTQEQATINAYGSDPSC